MKEFFQSKNFLKALLVVGCVFALIVIIQFATIISLNSKQNSLNNKLNGLAGQESYYQNLYNEASSDGYAEGFAKNEGNMKNENETVYKGE